MESRLGRCRTGDLRPIAQTVRIDGESCPKALQKLYRLSHRADSYICAR